jgi:polyphosphate kinase
MINKEIENKKAGLSAGIKLKLNAITNFSMIQKLYEASKAGVSIQMVVRGICCLIPGVKGMSENIEVISVIDRYLEHPRVYIFENGGKRKVYISSADFMTRNIENRVEVAVPIYDTSLQQQILDVFDITWKDNHKARIINKYPQNQFKKSSGENVRSQWAIYDYYNNQL